MVMQRMIFVLLVAVPCIAADSYPQHMIPSMKYTLSNPAPGKEGSSQQFASPTYFEVDAPTMKMKYSEVVWRTLPAVDLPAEVVSKYSNGTMAVVGFETNLLRKTADGKTEPVAAYENYNHHYGVSLVSAAARLKLDADGRATGPDMGHGKILEFETRPDAAPPPTGARLSQSFIHGNGQEHRQIFHGAPKGYAQPIFAPKQFVFTPMQIATNDGTGRKGTPNNPWIIPRIKQAAGKTPAPQNPPFSPLLECPCTTRITNLQVDGDCRPEPLSDLLVTNNPTCNSSTYLGGLSCCPDGGFLLDADQTVPDFTDEVFYRFRFYYQDYDPAQMVNIEHVEWAGNGCDSGCGGKCPNGCHHIEFDVVKGVGSDQGPQVQKFQSTFAAGQMLAAECTPHDGQCMDKRTVDPSKGFKLIMAAAHCHAPNCIRQELINKDTGEVLCNGVPMHGTSDTVYDEEGYLSTPPCLWGEQEGLMDPPVLMENTTMQMITYFNSTYWHPGQMAIWQMKAAAVGRVPSHN